MEKTTRILTTPAPGTVIGPIREYTEQQQDLIKQLGEVSGETIHSGSKLTHRSLPVRPHSTVTGVRPILCVGEAVARKARYHATIHACGEVEVRGREETYRGYAAVEKGVQARVDSTRRGECSFRLSVLLI